MLHLDEDSRVVIGIASVLGACLEKSRINDPNWWHYLKDTNSNKIGIPIEAPFLSRI
jgi:hypothetical protein